MRVLHLTGSPVSDFYADLSRLYAADCLAATASDRYEPTIAYVSPDGRWRFPAGLDREALDAAPALTLAEALPRMQHVDVAVPQMFCLPGMTTYRALLDLLAIPFVGNAPDVMALAAHKARAKAVVAAAGVRVPAGELLRPGQRPSFRPPAVVKPVDADNSLGIALVREPSQWDAALAKAFVHSGDVLVEAYVELGREVRCGIVVRDGELVCLPLEEYAVDAVAKPVRTHDDKIGATEAGDLRLLAKDGARAWIVDVADPITERVWEAARRCHVALGCRHYSLFDFRIDRAGEPYFLEASLYSSYARQSVLTMMAAAAGIALGELFALGLAEATR